MIDSLLSGMNLMLAGAIFALLMTAKKLMPEVFASKTMMRVLPVLPIALGVVGALMGICAEDLNRWQDKLVVGVLAGFMAANIFKIGKTTLLGRGLDDASEPAQE